MRRTFILKSKTLYQVIRYKDPRKKRKEKYLQGEGKVSKRWMLFETCGEHRRMLMINTKSLIMSPWDLLVKVHLT